MPPPHDKYRRSPGERRPTGQPRELTLTSAAFGGRMVAREEDGRVVFVQGGIPGEEVRAEVTLEKARFAEARGAAVLSPSRARSIPPCPFFGENAYNRGSLPEAGGLSGSRGACGGCQYQHIDYQAQLALKSGIVADLMRRQAGLPDLTILPAIASPDQWNYRNRARFIIDDEGEPSYHQAASERLLAVDGCHIVQPLIARLLGVLRDPAWRLPLRMLVGAVTVRTATPWRDDDLLTPDPVAHLVIHPRPGAKRRDIRLFARDLGMALPELEGIGLGSAQDEGGRAGQLWGANYCDARFGRWRFRLSPLTFFQVNEPAALLMVEAVMRALDDFSGARALDLYAGAGTFTLPMAERMEHVIAIENNPTAVEDARASAEVSRLKGIHIAPGDVYEELTGLPRQAAEVVVLDPPRSGVDPSIIEELARIGPRRLVYVSCDPPTLARDLKRFGELGYQVESVQPVDLFPQTSHVESIAVLQR